MPSDSTKQAEKQARELARTKAGECVRVVVRVRPMSHKESQDGRTCCTVVDDAASTIRLTNPKADNGEPPKPYTFDQVYGAKAQQKVIYDRTAAGIVDSVVEGFNGTIFAYGQTGTGKTFTMEGIADPPELRGIIPNSFKHIFQKIDLEGAKDRQFLVRASYLEIYNDEIRDLLSKDPKNRLELKESVDTGVYVKNQKVLIVKSVAEIDQVMQTGKKYRSVGSTLMNQTSSRSHSIFTVIIETSQLDPNTGETHIRVGKLNLVDLAGSERQSKTGATGQRRLEATKINLSLSALGNVISALVEARSQHIPYRDSKLTRLLQDSLGGNTKTVMIANCGPADYNYDETLSTLRYANRAKNIKNKPKINEDPKDAMLREFQEEIERLKQRVQDAEAGRPMSGMDGTGEAGGAGGRFSQRGMMEGVDERQVEELKEKLEKQNKAEKAQIQQEAEERMRKVLDEKEFTEREKKELETKAIKAAEQAHRAAKAKDTLQKKLKQMEEKLLKGVLVLDQAALQEEKLRKAELELQERKMQEQRLAQELASKEEDLSLKEEKFSSMQEEVDVKTKKLKKIWTKYQSVKSEARDLHDEFARERDDMLDTIRELTRQLKLKQIIIGHFVPPDEAEKINSRAKWVDEEDNWSVGRLQFAGNITKRPKRPVAHNGSKQPQTDFERQRRQYDSNPRYKHENVVQLEIDMPERTTQDYDGTAMSQRVDAAVHAALMADDEEAIELSAPENLPTFNPYLTYPNEEDDDGAGGGGSSKRRGSSDRRDGGERRSSKSGSSSRRSSKSGKARPGTASRSGRKASTGSSNGNAIPQDMSSNSNRWVDDEFEEPAEYPAARGLVGRR